VRIVGVCGSLQAASSNLTLLREVAAVLPAGTAFEICDLVRELPLFDPDIEAQGPAPKAVATWRSTLGAADALIIASPEYGHSLPGALKNAIDWVIGTGELNEKVVGVTASTNAPGRGQRGLVALTRTLAAVNATIVGGEPIVRDDHHREVLAQFVADVIERAS
jgi:NAD(P)H-dependent FMN reductase